MALWHARIEFVGDVANGTHVAVIRFDDISGMVVTAAQRKNCLHEAGIKSENCSRLLQHFRSVVRGLFSHCNEGMTQQGSYAGD